MPEDVFYGTGSSGYHWSAVYSRENPFMVMMRKCAQGTRKGAYPMPPPRKVPRRRARTVAKREIKKYQKSTDLLIPREPFRKLVRETVQEEATTDMRIAEDAFKALQEAAEAYITKLFKDSAKIATKEKRETVTPEDLTLVRELRGELKKD